MIEITRRRTYWHNLFLTTVILQGLIFLIGFIKLQRKHIGFNSMLEIAVIMQLILIIPKSTYQITIVDGVMEIIYYKWLKKHCIEFKIRDAAIEKYYYKSAKGLIWPRYNIYSNGNLIYKLKDPFGQEEMEQIEDAIKSVKK